MMDAIRSHSDFSVESWRRTSTLPGSLLEYEWSVALFHLNVK